MLLEVLTEYSGITTIVARILVFNKGYQSRGEDHNVGPVVVVQSRQVYAPRAPSAMRIMVRRRV